MYDVEARAEGTDGLDGNGLLMMGVDILPSELPKEASQHFGELLLTLNLPPTLTLALAPTPILALTPNPTLPLPVPLRPPYRCPYPYHYRYP